MPLPRPMGDGAGHPYPRPGGSGCAGRLGRYAAFGRRSVTPAQKRTFAKTRRYSLLCPLPRKTPPPLAKTLSGSPGPPRSPERACVGVLFRDLPAHREAVVWRGETLLLDPRRRWDVV